MLFFVDESGIDKKHAPYEVLAATSIKEEKLWQFIKAEQKLELDRFGVRLADLRAELKGSKLLSKKRFRFANQAIEITEADQRIYAKSFLEKGSSTAGTMLRPNATAIEYTAFGRASLQFVDELLDLASAFEIKVFASMVDVDAPSPASGAKLRKDYVYLLERMFYYIESIDETSQGLIVFDELEKAMARLLIDQTFNYFTKTAKGRERSRRIVPEPFFVHSDLTTVIQLTDIIAYIINWGFRAGTKMTKPLRGEIVPYAQKVNGMQFREYRTEPGEAARLIFGITCIDDLRGMDERP